MTTPPTAVRDATAGEDFRRMAPIYAAVILVEVVTLVAMWWFQTTFGV